LGGENENFGAWKSLEDLSGCFSVVQKGHGDIHGNDLRLKPLGHLHGFASRFRLANDLNIAVRLDY